MNLHLIVSVVIIFTALNIAGKEPVETKLNEPFGLASKKYWELKIASWNGSTEFPGLDNAIFIAGLKPTLIQEAAAYHRKNRSGFPFNSSGPSHWTGINLSEEHYGLLSSTPWAPLTASLLTIGTRFRPVIEEVKIMPDHRGLIVLDLFCMRDESNLTEFIRKCPDLEVLVLPYGGVIDFDWTAVSKKIREIYLYNSVLLPADFTALKSFSSLKSMNLIGCHLASSNLQHYGTPSRQKLGNWGDNLEEIDLTLCNSYVSIFNFRATTYKSLIKVTGDATSCLGITGNKETQKTKSPKLSEVHVKVMYKSEFLRTLFGREIDRAKSYYDFFDQTKTKLFIETFSLD